MTAKGYARAFRPLTILNEEQIEAIHRSTLDVLEVTGVTFESERALKLLEKGGCRVDYDQRRARFPTGLVEGCLGQCPSTFRLRARNPENDVHLGGNTTYFCAFPGMRTVDLDTWEQRPATVQENHDANKVLDALDTVHLAPSYTPYCYHPVQSVLDDDLMGMIGRFMEGITVTNETLATDVIQEVGPIPGFFLAHPHTREWWMKEQFLPKVADRLSYHDWLNSGQKSALDHARERVDAILASPEPTPPLPPGKEEELNKILEEARAYYKKKDLL